MKQDKKAPTLSDVANSAGVSLYTASVVLNGARSNTRVSEATRRRILESAATLRYHPNAMARGLVHRRMQTLGVFFGVVEPSIIIMNPYASTLLQGVLKVAAESAYRVTIFTEPWQDAATSALRFRDGRTDGVLVIAPPLDIDLLPGLASLGLSLSVIAAPGERYGIPAVDVDNAKGIRLAVEHLIGLEHHRIAHITGNPNMASVPVRRDTFCATMNAAGCPVPDEYLIASRYDGRGVEEALKGLLSLAAPPTAIIAGNDTLAIGALLAARNLGVRIPEDLSIVGFDDAPAGAFLTPPLTTVRQPLLEIGELATRLLIQQIEGETVPVTAHLLEPELVVRGSTAPAGDTIPPGREPRT